jgi:hypothetical protein
MDFPLTQLVLHSPEAVHQSCHVLSYDEKVEKLLCSAFLTAWKVPLQNVFSPLVILA